MGILILLGAVVLLGSAVFAALLKNSVIINPSLEGLFSQWLGCLVGTAVVLYLGVDLLWGAISWLIDFIKEDYPYLLGGIAVLGLLGVLANRNSKG